MYKGTLSLLEHGSTFATRSKAREILDKELGSGESHWTRLIIDASGMFMSSDFISEALVQTVMSEERSVMGLVFRVTSEVIAGNIRTIISRYNLDNVKLIEDYSWDDSV